MIRTIYQSCLYANYRICGQRTFYAAFCHAPFNCREVVLRNCAAEYFLLEYIRFFQVTGRFKDHLNITVLAMSAGLLLIFALNLNFLS